MMMSFCWQLVAISDLVEGFGSLAVLYCHFEVTNVIPLLFVYQRDSWRCISTHFCFIFDFTLASLTPGFLSSLSDDVIVMLAYLFPSCVLSPQPQSVLFTSL